MKIFPGQTQKNLPAAVAVFVVPAGFDWTASSASSQAGSPPAAVSPATAVASAGAVASLPPSPVVAPAGAVLRLRLNSVFDTDRNRPGDRFAAVPESPVMGRCVGFNRGHERPDWTFVSGGSGVGAIMGVLAGGGAEAAIGRSVGPVAGAAGAVWTAEHEILLPAGSVVSFTLRRPVTISLG